MLTPEMAAGRVIALADRVRDLSVRRRSPHAFFEERSEIEADLRKLAAEISGKGGRGATPAPRGAFRTGVIAMRGRAVSVETRGRRKGDPARAAAAGVFA